MKLIEWLMKGDYALQRLASKYLLDKEIEYNDHGYINRYIDLYDENKGLWGNGIYSPKWISTHYTMRELRYMEIDPNNKYYQKSLGLLLDREWRPEEASSHKENYDVCVVAMVASLCSYGGYRKIRIYEIIDELLVRQMSDGGWNCSWNYDRRPSVKSSFHTTLTVLECLRDFSSLDDGYKRSIIESLTRDAQEYLLKRRLLFSHRTGKLIKDDFKKAHYPPRWKYDYLRALEYFASVDYPYDDRMETSLDILVKSFEKYGSLLKGSMYPGQIHFKLEDTNYGRFNTLRALKVLKKYKYGYYSEVISRENPKLM